MTKASHAMTIINQVKFFQRKIGTGYVANEKQTIKT